MAGEGQPLVVSERVRWADVDLVGIMRFSAFTRLVENAEQELMREAGLPYAALLEKPDFWMPRRHLSIDYFAPARIDDELALVTYVSRIGDTSVMFQVDVMSPGGDTLYAAATMAVVCVNVSDFQKRKLPQAIRDGLARFLVSREEARRSPTFGGRLRA